MSVLDHDVDSSLPTPPKRRKSNVSEFTQSTSPRIRKVVSRRDLSGIEDSIKFRDRYFLNPPKRSLAASLANLQETFEYSVMNEIQKSGRSKTPKETATEVLKTFQSTEDFQNCLLKIKVCELQCIPPSTTVTRQPTPKSPLEE